MAVDRRSAHRRRRPVLVPAVAAVAILLSGVVACDAGPTTDGPVSAVASPPSSAPDREPAAHDIPLADLAAIRATVDALNSAAGGRPTDQRDLLANLVEPARQSVVNACPPPATTVRFEPVYPGLRIATEAPASVPGAVSYALPSLIRVYTGERETGTDLTTLLLVVQPSTEASGSGAETARTEAYLTPFCVN